ncbi:pimeloyl-ACP methyl ester carboxylesterase [Saccharomonospora amisosensis]|uniref:Pimeloyl-ACP methyl ester carboxylesterase n=1 Tax=Saccharomonospora amisosensis TaxID=1128677 RepID=A0A7X5UTP3_9PSEU|nr:alpha/beta fold hydrolase [Saccharomonospora amisosensis]NIJ13935.1 pimeloyl-ACP methyl ester carboxylesterase [Saccharomonospora amisosensis]
MSTLSQTQSFLTSDGTGLHVRVDGPADASGTLVLVHGWTQDHTTWDRVLPHLSSGLRTLRYDLRGHGRSAPANPGTATIERLADDLAELLTDRAGQGRLVLAGHSMGGMTIMALAERHPRLVAERVGGVAFVATSCGEMNRITLGLPGAFGGGAARLERRLAKLLAGYRGDGLPLRPAAARAGARWLVFGRRPRKEDVASVAEQLLRAHPASVGQFQDAISVHDRRAALTALRGLPAVVLAGGSDRLCPVPHARTICDELPGTRLVLFPGAGHMLPQERAAEVAVQLDTLAGAALGRAD